MTERARLLFTDAQFIPAALHRRCQSSCWGQIAAANADTTGRPTSRLDNLDQELAELMVATGMSYFRNRHHSGSQ